MRGHEQKQSERDVRCLDEDFGLPRYGALLVPDGCENVLAGAVHARTAFYAPFRPSAADAPSRRSRGILGKVAQ